MLPKIKPGLILSASMVLAILPLPSLAQGTSQAVRDISHMQVDERLLRDAVASRTLTWLTGSSSNNDYVSVGRLANFFGFVGLRVASGHSLTRSAVGQDALSVLTQTQHDALVSLLEDQREAFRETQIARYNMNRALEGLLIGEKISQSEFLDLGRAYSSHEAELGRVIGQRLGQVAQTLNPDQEKALADIRAAHISGQAVQISRRGFRIDLSREDKQELFNIASRFLTWTTGSQAFNDFETVGKPSQHFGFVSLRIDSNHGVRRGDVSKEVQAMLTDGQREFLETAVVHDTQRFEDFLRVRSQLMRTLEVALTGATIDSAEVKRLGAELGEIEASMTWAQANAMLKVREDMSEAQLSDLLAMRAKYTTTEQGALPDE